jgi:uncharacterized protein
MPVTPTYPGVYIEELSSGVRTITGVATSITAFIGRALKGPLSEPIRIQNFSEFQRQFGGLWQESTMSYAVQQYFLNGGQDALIVRVYNGNREQDTAKLTIDSLALQATSPGLWGGNLRAFVDHETRNAGDETLFNLTVQLVESPTSARLVATETLRNLSSDKNSSRFYKKIIELESELVDVTPGSPDLSGRPAATPKNNQQQVQPVRASSTGGDGSEITDTDIASDDLRLNREGLYALEKADLFNLLCIPPLTRSVDVSLDATMSAAVRYCQERRALLIIDPPLSTKTIRKAGEDIDAIRTALGGEAFGKNAAVFFPRIKMGDPLQENRTEEFAPCGVVAGIFARTDATRGVWKAPAGIEAGILGVRELSYKMTDGENGILNPKGLNCIRLFRNYGNVLWGSRTLAGSDAIGSEWKYIPVRRFALFLEESLYRGTQWVVFEPNDEPLWAQIRLNLGAFMNNLFRQGAFQGKTPKEAYFVKCDKETTTQNDINLGIVNIVVGFAPLKPAEFVIIKFQQIAGQIDT